MRVGWERAYFWGSGKERRSHVPSHVAPLVAKVNPLGNVNPRCPSRPAGILTTCPDLTSCPLRCPSGNPIAYQPGDFFDCCVQTPRQRQLDWVLSGVRHMLAEAAREERRHARLRNPGPPKPPAIPPLQHPAAPDSEFVPVGQRHMKDPMSTNIAAISRLDRPFFQASPPVLPEAVRIGGASPDGHSLVPDRPFFQDSPLVLPEAVHIGGASPDGQSLVPSTQHEASAFETQSSGSAGHAQRSEWWKQYEPQPVPQVTNKDLAELQHFLYGSAPAENQPGRGTDMRFGIARTSQGTLPAASKARTTREWLDDPEI